MKNNITAAIIIAIALVAHAYIVRPQSYREAHSVPSRAFKSETKRALEAAIDGSGKRSEVKSIDIEAVRVSQDGVRVLVDFTVRVSDRAISSGLVYSRDEFGRYYAQGRFEGLIIDAAIK